MRGGGDVNVVRRRRMIDVVGVGEMMLDMFVVRSRRGANVAVVRDRE